METLQLRSGGMGKPGTVVPGSKTKNCPSPEGTVPTVETQAVLSLQPHPTLGFSPQVHRGFLPNS
jgi:hypothetical protein